MREFIFGVGLHKTGTHSLNLALRELGYKSMHKLVLEDLSLEEYDAYCHPPVCSIYRQLNVLYPNSKFILTTRETETWLRSFQNHMKKFQRDPSAKLLKGQKYFTSALKKELQITYGSPEIFNDIEKLCQIKENHDKDVLEYGLDNIAVLPIEASSGEKWEILCSFLEKPKPNIAFPHEHKGKNWDFS